MRSASRKASCRSSARSEGRRERLACAQVLRLRAEARGHSRTSDEQHAIQELSERLCAWTARRVLRCGRDGSAKTHVRLRHSLTLCGSSVREL